MAVWTEQAEAVLRRLYPEHGAAAVRREIGREFSMRAIYQQARKLGIERVMVGPWTAAEDAVIAALYPDGGTEACVPMLPDRTPIAIQARAKRIRVAREVHCSDDVDTPIPAHEYTEADYAIREWRGPVLPVLSSFVPALGRRVAA